MPSTPTQSGPDKKGCVAGASPASATDPDLILYALVAANAAETKRRKKAKR
jgi:hypothetical protein